MKAWKNRMSASDPLTRLSTDYSGPSAVCRPWSNSTMKRARRIPPSLVRKAIIRQRYSLADLLLQIPEGAPIDGEWDAMPPVGREIEPALDTLRSIRAM